ncbi:MAG: glycosyltransferase family 4 protein [Armatimonadota bacterium]
MAERRAFRLLIYGVRWPPETFILRLVRGLVGAGISVTVGCSSPPTEKGIGWLQIPPSDPMAMRVLRTVQAVAGVAFVSPRRALRLVATLSRNARGKGRWEKLLPLVQARWDVVYFPWNSCAISALPAFELLPPVVVSCRGAQVNVAPHNPARADIADGHRAVFAKAAAVHCVSEAIKREAMKYGLPPEKAWVIRPAVDPEVFRPSERTETRSNVIRIVTCGRLIWRKGYEYALKAMRLVVDRGCSVEYHIIGDGPERQRLLYTVHDLELEAIVTLHYQKSEGQVVQILQQSDIFLLSSLSEGIGNAVLEAMSCGLPVVTTDCGGMREAVTDGVEGFVVPVRDPYTMADAILRLARNPELRQWMGHAARERVLREFALDGHITSFAQMLRAAATGQ